MSTPLLNVSYNDQKITVEWSKQDAATSYIIVVFGANGKKIVRETIPSDQTQYIIDTEGKPFIIGATYFISIKGIGTDPESWSAPQELVFNTIEKPVTQPTYVDGDLQATVATPGADNNVYTFQLQPKATEATAVKEAIGASKTLPVSISKQLTVGQTYQVRSEAWVSNSKSDWSDYVDIIIIKVEKPNLTIDYANKIISCSWQEIANANGYELELWSTGQNPQMVFSQKVTKAPYQVEVKSGFNEDEEYLGKLRAYQDLCYSAWDEKAVFTSTLSPVLKDLYDRLIAAFNANNKKTLTLDSDTIGDPGKSIITLFQSQLQVDEITLSSSIAIQMDPANDQVLVAGYTSDNLLGLNGGATRFAFSTNSAKTDILVKLDLPTGSQWKFTDTLPTFGSTYLDAFTFDQSTTPTAFTLVSVNQGDLITGLNFSGDMQVTGPLQALSKLITDVNPQIKVTGQVVQDSTKQRILLKASVPDLTLDFSGFQTLTFSNPAFVFLAEYTIANNNYQLSRWVESDVSLGGTSLPLAVRLPDRLKSWAIMLTPGRTMPLGNVPTFLGFIAGLDLSKLMPTAIDSLDCFILTSFNLSFTEDKLAFKQLSLALTTDPKKKKLWEVLPELSFDQLNLQLVVNATSGKLTYRSVLLGVFSLTEKIALQTSIVLPVGTDNWFFSIYTKQPIDSFSALSSFMGGADLGTLLPSGLKDIGSFSLNAFTMVYNPASNNLVSIRLGVQSASPWVLIKDRLIMQRIGFDVTINKPTSDERSITGQVQGILSIGKGNILATINKQKSDSAWLFTVELQPGTSIEIADVAGLAGITSTDIEAALPTQLSVLGNLALTQFYLEYNISTTELTDVSFAISITKPWDVYKDKVVVKSSTLSVGITPATTTDPYKITATINGTIQLGAAELILGATNANKDQNWLFKGELADGTTIDFTSLFTSLSETIALPESSGYPKSVTIKSFSTEVTPALQKFYFELSTVFDWKFDFALAKFEINALNAALTLENPDPKKPTQYVFKSGGTFTFSGITTDLYLQLSNKQSDTFLEAQLTDANAKTVKVSNLSNNLTTSGTEGTPWSTLPLPTGVTSIGYNTAKLHVNLTQNTFILFGQSASFGAIGFLAKRLQDDSWGYLVGLALSDGFTFASICSGLSVVDSILRIKHAGFSISSFAYPSIQELTSPLPEFQAVVDLPAGSNAAPLKEGLSIYGTIVFEGDLMGKVIQVVQSVKEDSGITLYAHISQTAGQSIFMASMGNLSLFNTIVFNRIALSYQPESPTDPKVKNILKLSGDVVIDIDDNNKPSFTGSMSIDSEKASITVETTNAISSPWGMFNITLEKLKLELAYTFKSTPPYSKAKELSTTPTTTTSSTISLTGEVGFGKKVQDKYPVLLSGAIFFNGGTSEVCSISLAQPLDIDNFLTTIMPSNLWPTGWLKVTFETGSIYYAKKEITINGTTYSKGFHVISTISIYDFVFNIEVDVVQGGLTFKGNTTTSINLVFAELMDKEFKGNSPELTITTIGDQKKFGFDIGIQIFKENIGISSIYYNITDKQFEGSVTYNGKILDQENPSITFGWSKEKGFQLVSIEPLNLISDAYDYAKNLQELSKTISSGSGCKQLVGLAFDKAIQTSYEVSMVANGITTVGDAVEIPIEVTCVVDLLKQKKISKSIQLPVVIEKPAQATWQDFLTALLSTVVNSAEALAKQILEDPTDFAEFIALAGLKKMASSTVSSLMCRKVDSKEVKEQAEDGVESESSEAAESAEAAEAGASAAEGAATAAGAAAAGSVSVEAVGAIGVVIGALAGLVAGLASLFGVDKSPAQKEAEAQKKKAEAAAERVKKAVEKKLQLATPTIVYNENDTIAVGVAPVAGGHVNYEFILLKAGSQIDSKTLDTPSYTFSNDQIEPGVSYTIKVRATLTYKTTTYTGAWSENSLDEKTIPAPTQLTCAQVEDNLLLNWQSGDAQSSSYVARVLDSNGNPLAPQPVIQIVDTQATIQGSTLQNDTSYIIELRAFTADKKIFSRWSKITVKYSTMVAPTSITKNLTYQLDGSIEIETSWAQVNGITNFAVRQVTDKGVPVNPQPTIVINALTATLNSSAFAAGPTVYWQIGSQNVDKTETVWSTIQSIVLLDLPVPSGILLTYTTPSDGVSAIWTAEPAATSYSFQLLDSQKKVVGKVQTDLTDAQATVQGEGIAFQAGEVYSAQVKAVAQNATTVWSTPVNITIVKLEAPQNLKLSYVAQSKTVDASWDPVTAAKCYDFDLEDDQGTKLVHQKGLKTNAATIVASSVPLEAGKTYYGLSRAYSDNCFSGWTTKVAVQIPEQNPLLPFIEAQKAAGKNVYQAAIAIATDHPDSNAEDVAKGLFNVYKTPPLSLDEMSWAIWFGGVKKAEALQALQAIFPSTSIVKIQAAIHQVWSPTPEILATYLKKAGFDATATVAKMKTVINALSPANVAVGLNAADYSLLRSAAAVKAGFNTKPTDLGTALKRGFKLDSIHGIIPMGAVFNYTGVSLIETSAILRSLYGTLWTVDDYNEILSMYKSDTWADAFTDYVDNTSAIDTAVSLKQKHPSTAVTTMDAILSSIFDLYLPHVSVAAIGKALKASNYSLEDAAAGLKELYQPDWNVDDYSTLLSVYKNE